jgi:hypothetical protein
MSALELIGRTLLVVFLLIREVIAATVTYFIGCVGSVIRS